MSPAKVRVGSRLASAPVRFSFDGRQYTGQRGDTAASALLAHGVRFLGRSLKYRRPRGLLTAGPEEPNVLLTVGSRPTVIPNVPAPLLVLTDGLEFRSQNRWPSLHCDVASLLQVGGGFFGAGFYYKTFMWPSWRSYETIVRNLAGLGEAPGVSTLPPPAIEHLSCDVLVGGAGPAGLAAALAAARAGARVVVCEREPECGGELEFEGGTIDGRPGGQWVAAVAEELGRRGARVLTDTAIVGGSGGLLIAHAEPGGLAGRNKIYQIRPRHFVIAMGAVERPIAFVDNDRPGVMLLGAAERYLARYGAAAGNNLVLFGNHDRLYAAAGRFVAAGLRVRAIVDSRTEAAVADGGTAANDLRAKLQRGGIECLLGYAVLATEGRAAVHGARVAPLASPHDERRIACDAILVSGGWSPAIHAGLHEGGKRRYADCSAAFIAAGQPEWRTGAGASNGALDLAAVVADGFAAGERAARAVGTAGSAGPAPIAYGDGPPRLAPFWSSPASTDQEKRQFVDFQNDVTVADLRQALAEGFIDIEHIKRYTTLGVGTEQGRTSGVLGAAIVAELKRETLLAVGTSRTRPPYHPVTLAALAGHRSGQQIRVTRRTPLHEWQEGHGGVLEPAEYWMRTRYYRANGANAFAAGVAEAARVRAVGGILDGSTLGKIEVAGQDAAAYLDRMYLNRASTIKVGRSKYMVNLREDGMVLDDGIVLRLADDRYFATTSSGHAGHMLAHFEHYADTEWGGRDVALTDVTEAWAVIVVAGPASRDTLRDVLGSAWHADLGRLTHMDFATGRWHGRELRVLRAGFSGELAFELHCRPAIAVPLWQALVDGGLEPYGLEALDILRVEKGYLVGAELNGQTTPHDLGMDGLVELGNPCIGRPLLDRPAFHEASRPRLVGLRTVDGKATILGGAQITTVAVPNRSVGHITSAVYSPALREWIGLALVARSLAAEGTQLVARDPLRGGDTAVRVSPLVHFDPSGERMKS
ncbi:MAG TPA: 2Fe-2S iron-sulfur cluster-binding protein [Steroidobacteraceae bacterium]|nr:2Fe-2S iron-sulfur cluster-binding protein [Steroidobacteraceae bacterium]